MGKQKTENCAACHQPMNFTVQMRLSKMDDECANIIAEVVKEACEIIRSGRKPEVVGGKLLPKKGLQTFVKKES